MANGVNVIEKNEGPKIEWEQNNTKLFFGDDEIMVNCAKYQKDWPVHVDICKDRAGNLTIGTAGALRYVAEIDIPQAAYSEDEEERTQLPIDMSEVDLTLWSIE